MPLPDLEAWMWIEACEVLDRADRLHRQFFRPAVMSAKQPTWEPPIDIYETSNEFIITVALPGVAPEHLKVILDDEYLTIDGRRYLPASFAAHIRRLEIPYGRFERRIKLPGGCLEMGTREFVNGCLLIALRKI
ncbi:MAG: Hsp20/alpha crystallin family protein [Methylococcaceae bacterium]